MTEYTGGGNANVALNGSTYHVQTQVLENSGKIVSTVFDMRNSSVYGQPKEMDCSLYMDQVGIVNHIANLFHRRTILELQEGKFFRPKPGDLEKKADEKPAERKINVGELVAA